jgi:hypothetical protein
MTTPTKLFAPAQLGTGNTTYYTVPANTTCIIKKLTLTNTSAGAVTASVWLVPNAGAPGNSNAIHLVIAIAANAVYEVYEAENHVLNAGDFISALASAGGDVTIQGSGIQVV